MPLSSDDKFKRELAMLALAAYDAIDDQMAEEMLEDLLRKLNAFRATVLQYEQLVAGDKRHEAMAAELRKAFDDWDSAVRKKFSLKDTNRLLRQDPGKTGDPHLG